MPVAGLDHVNIVTANLDRTVEFYQRVLGLTRFDHPMFNGPDAVANWLCDEGGHPILHIQRLDDGRHAGRGAQSAPHTGAIDHVALRCQGFDAQCARLDALGIPYRVNPVPEVGIRQVLVTDPDNIDLELNFAGD